MAITSASADLTTKLAPFNPTDTAAIKEVVRLANFSPSDVLYDLGCGDGRVLIYAATSTPLKRAVGVEYDKTYADRAKVAVKEAGLEERVTIFHGDAMTHDISGKHLSHMRAHSQYLIIRPMLYTRKDCTN
jgi:tRNA1(Val) A37 N6-methylase TrmN6